MIVTRKLNSTDNIYLKEISEAEKNSFSTPLSEKMLNDILKTDSYVIYCIFEDDILCAYCILTIVLDEAQILSVCSLNKRKGYTLNLLTNMIQYLRNIKVNKIYLEVRSSNIAAISLYNKLGFITDGLRKRMYTKPTEDGLIMHI